MNEYLAARAVLRPLASLLHDANAVAGIPLEERYTYAYEQNAQEIDHVFVSHHAFETNFGVVEAPADPVWAIHCGRKSIRSMLQLEWRDKTALRHEARILSSTNLLRTGVRGGKYRIRSVAAA